MEGAHPVPQNITSFEFRLIGDMTLKQFLYLAVGVGTSYITFVFLATRVPFFAWPVMVISAISGIAFAFLPISDRPLDYWVRAFLKAVYSPTKRVWQKNGHLFSAEPLFASRLNIYLSPQLPPLVQPQTIAAELQTLPPKQPPSQSPGADLPTSEELTQTVELAKQAQSLQVKILESQRELNQIRDKPDIDEFNEVFNNLQTLVQEAQSIKKQLAILTKEPQIETPPVKIEVVKPPQQKQTQLTLTTFPNVINGIVTDSTGNYLDGVVVVIHSKEGLPVRALKTNKLGQFTGSTPLPNGIYTIELEKDNLIFDVLQIELEGKLLPPLAIAAKRAINS